MLRFTTLLLIAVSPAAAFAADPSDKEIDDLNEAIRPFSNVDQLAHLVRGEGLLEKGEFDRAMSECNEALRLDPKDPMAYFLRSAVWTAKGETDKAIADCNEAIRLDPKSDAAYLTRGLAWSCKQQYDKAIADYSEAIRLRPDSPEGYNGVAWLRATCPDSRYRDAAAAIDLATKACKRTLWRSSLDLDALAAAYAESGDFDKAVQWGEKALAAAGDDDEEKEEIRGRLALYRQHKPYREKFGKEELPK